MARKPTLARPTALASRPRSARAGYHQSLFWRCYERLSLFADRTRGWDRLAKPVGLALLIGLRSHLRKHNLYDTSEEPAADTAPVGPRPHDLTVRTVDGTYNDPDRPSMGMAGSRFGRNVPIDQTWQEPAATILTPSPREVSRTLLTRRELQPATGANALVAAWLQFMIRDWLSHGPSPKDDPWSVELAPDDDWQPAPMLIMRTRPDPTRPDDPSKLPLTWANTETHWWDGSQIYGKSIEEQRFVRSGSDGKLRLDPNGLPVYPTGADRNPAMVPGFWLGLAMMQTVFSLEHNTICDRSARPTPRWTATRSCSNGPD